MSYTYPHGHTTQTNVYNPLNLNEIGFFEEIHAHIQTQEVARFDVGTCLAKRCAKAQ